MSTFAQILNKFRQDAFSERDKGYRFERLMQAYLKTTTLYANLFEEVWLWTEFPFHDQFGGKDTGIDLVARTVEGEYWAIQCKCYAANAFINKPDVDTFLSTSGKRFETESGMTGFVQRLWISTTNKWNPTAEQTIRNQNPPVTRLNLIDLENDDVDWNSLEQGIFGMASRSKPFTIREHQQQAIDQTHAYFKIDEATGQPAHTRGKLIMACGTGKTFTSLRIAENETGGRGLVLFLVPSIALLGQTLRSWLQQAMEPMMAVCICSDPQVSKQTEKNDNDTTSVVDLALPASTDVPSIIKQLQHARRHNAEGLTVVFSTYQSIDVISRAQQQLLKETGDAFGTFDLIICDEAHRTTGVTLKDETESAFVRVHNNDFLRAVRRIYMTATPRLYTDETKKRAEENSAVLCSMDDRSMYGDEIYRIGFGEAVKQELLSDYKVLILAVGEKDITPTLQNALTREDGTIDADDPSKLIGCINALSKKVLGADEEFVKGSDPLPMRRAVAFCSSIKASKAIANAFTDYKDLYMEDIREEDRATMVDVVAHHVDGSMSATKRDEELMWLKEQPENERECRMLTNARCLSEGVDVPSLDAVVFISPKNSQVDVVQSVGRVMRRSEGKKYGYIIIPVVVPANAEGDKVLENHPNFKVVWTVLNALRAHDDRFNAEVNKIELSKKKPKNILFGGVGASRKDEDQHSDGDSKPRAESAAEQLATQLSMSFNDLQNVFYAKLVTKVGTKRYWELWARDIAQIAEQHIERIKALIADNGKHRRAFDQLIRGLHRNINPGLSEQDAIEMLSQHIISRPVFEALFENYQFAASNPISRSMQKMLDLLDDETKTEEEHQKLQKFYDYVRDTVGNIHEAEGRQRIIVELYDKFFKVASPRTVEKLGIVYTPVEVVDFIIRSVGYILQREFGRSLSDENVHILDPFTGTGTFITRLLQSGLISREALERKYGREIHANEIVLMAYYIASVNIENVFHDLMGPDTEYRPFGGICLTDTFQLGEEAADENLYSEQFPTNSRRVIEQKKRRITVIVGNPPYSVGQKSANDNAQNQKYPALDSQIERTYAAETDANNKNSLYDSYIRAFRWASDRLDKKDGGVIGFITNGNWLDSNAQNGMRKCLEREFSTIYVFNLRGAIRARSKDLAKKEGQNIFDIMTGVAITILVKKPKASDEAARIYYHDIGDYLSREEKLRIIRNMGDISNPLMQWVTITPNEHGDWLNKRSEQFKLYTTLGDKIDKKNKKTFFVPYYSNGLKTQRDPWCYNSSLPVVEKSAKEQIDFYNEQREKLAKKEISDVDYSTHKISWTRAVLSDIQRNKPYNTQDCQFREGLYRPFFKQHLLFYRPLNEMMYQIPTLFPTSNQRNLVICVECIGARRDFTALITDCIPDLHVLEAAQCFPLYWYDDSTADIADLFSAPQSEMDRYVRRDGVTDWILSTARKQYGSRVTKEDIFYYVYGILHAPDYRTTFAADLKKSLPRLPLVKSPDDFWAFSRAGRSLAELHLGYEHVEPYAGCRTIYSPLTNRGDEISYLIDDKMRFGKLDSKTADKRIIHYNAGITIENIPLEAYDYVVNGKSAIEWVMERYAVKTDPASRIENNPNDWCREHDDPKYIYNLLLRIITVSLETMKIVRSLPKLKLEE
ncbi:putative septum site-determining protein MinC [Alistipes sp. CAG:268]|uniref:DEAD/DEAH box helicase n=1 Tax=Alistipes sp. CAG:268 TaxID=1262693 RepID=UPI000336D28B|nr:type ISP restriction/modification enzyme [Alistipes sp. CAG:268]CDC95766.1 putative septum site-determining protein MinC [Alistipes sp. CAG:268]